MIPYNQEDGQIYHYNCFYLDEDGGLIQNDNGNKTQIIFRTGLKATDTVYSDRLYQWDSDKYNNLCMKHWGNTGQMFGGRSIESIENFLTDYMDSVLDGGQKIKLTYSDRTTDMRGYPIQRFDYLVVSDKIDEFLMREEAI